MPPATKNGAAIKINDYKWLPAMQITQTTIDTINF